MVRSPHRHYALLPNGGPTGRYPTFLPPAGGRAGVWAKCLYEEVSKPGKLVFTLHFSDKEGRRVDRAGFSKESRIAVTFVEKGNQTEVTIRHTGLAADQGESEGWKQGLDRLTGLLASQEQGGRHDQ